MIKIVLLAPANSIHTVRWANGLAARKHEVYVISQHLPIENAFHPAVKTHIVPNRGILGYFLMVPRVRKWLREIQPDVVNAHYASGYGSTAMLSGFPYLLSVWGSDVYDFPYKSKLHLWLIRRNLMKAKAIASTSVCMAKQTQSLLREPKKIFIIPFGVDIKKFTPLPTVIEKNEIIIGTVKTMSHKYGIDILIRAFSLLVEGVEKKDVAIANRLRLRLVGGGEQIAELKELAVQEGIGDKVDFVGGVSHDQVPSELAKLDIYVALSRLESFGVAILEASSMEKPVVVSDVGGLPEVVVKEETGFIVERENPKQAAVILEKLVYSDELRIKLGKSGRKYVCEQYSWEHCLDLMIKAYETV